jgi:hypothetical protein
MGSTRVTYETIRQILRDAISFPDFVRANTILQDPVTRQEMLDRITAAPREFMITRDYSHKYALAGNVTVDNVARMLKVTEGDPTPDANEATFTTYSFGAPFRLLGWSFTAQDDGAGVDLFDLECFYRATTDPAASDVTVPWHKLLPEDCTEIMTSVQIKMVVGTLVTPLSIRRLAIFGEQT